MHSITIKTTRRNQLLDVTDSVSQLVKEHGIKAGAVLICVPHTTAGIIINECADPSVGEDILNHLEKIVPHAGHFQHSEGNSDAHIKSALVGTSLMLPLENGSLALGTWQGIFFAEFDGPRTRHFSVTFLS